MRNLYYSYSSGGIDLVTVGIDPNTCWFCGHRGHKSRAPIDYKKNPIQNRFRLLKFIEGYGTVHEFCLANSIFRRFLRQETSADERLQMYSEYGIANKVVNYVENRRTEYNG
jgi:hypothetical protein